MCDVLNIVNNNPIKRIDNYNKFVKILLEKFNDDDHKQFILNFYCYYKFNQDQFCVDFTRVSEFMGFSTIGNAKKVLLKSFDEDVDYIVQKLAYQYGKTSSIEESKFMEVKIKKQFY